MNSLQAVKIFFVNRIPGGPQRLGSNGYGDNIEGNYSSSTSEASGDNIEAGFGKSEQVKRPGLGRRITEYARRRKTSFADWSSAQPRNVWASIISAVLGIVVILYVYILFSCRWRHANKQLADTRQCSNCFVDILQHISSRTDFSQ